MTLFEAIRELRKGQAICGPLDSDERPIVVWHWCNPQPAGTFSKNMRIELHCNGCRIVDLPKPKMSLEEVLEKAMREIESPYINPALKSNEAKVILHLLRSLPIDWQAEADRKDNLK